MFNPLSLPHSCRLAVAFTLAAVSLVSATAAGAASPPKMADALLVADGKTNKEIAAALFLSPKTIEYHLRHVYRKLDISSREELAEAMRRR
jgi:DNA-binding CsgD family transcriptional regulator